MSLQNVLDERRKYLVSEAKKVLGKLEHDISQPSSEDDIINMLKERQLFDDDDSTQLWIFPASQDLSRGSATVQSSACTKKVTVN